MPTLYLRLTAARQSGRHRGSVRRGSRGSGGSGRGGRCAACAALARRLVPWSAMTVTRRPWQRVSPATNPPLETTCTMRLGAPAARALLENRLRGPFSKIGCEGPSRNRIGCEGHSRKPRPGAERAGLVRSGAAGSPGEGAWRGPSAGRCPQRSLFFAVPAVSVAVASFRFPMHEAPILISAAGRAGVAARVHPLHPAPCGTMQTIWTQPAWLAQAGRSVRIG